MRAFVLEHGEGCQPLEPCSVCKVFDHLRLSLNPAQFETYLSLIKEATVELPDPKKEVEPSGPVTDYVHIHYGARKKLLEVAPTIGDLLKLTVPQLKEKGVTDYSVKLIQDGLRRNLHRELSEV